MRGPPLPRPKCKPRNKGYVEDVEYLERSYRRDITKLENRVIEMAKQWHGRVRDYSDNPTSGVREDLLQSSYFSLDDSITALISFERNI